MPSAISSPSVLVDSAGSALIDNAQASVTTTAATLVAARATRRGVTILNMDSKEPIYLGKDATVSATTGLRIVGGQSISLSTVAAIFAVSATGTRTVAYFEEYD